MADESEPKGAVTTNIPFFFYDLVGRMVPGAYFIVGSIVSSWRFLPQYQFECTLSKTKEAEPSLVLSAVVVGVAVLVFTVTSLFLGFVLGALSHSVEKVWLWRKKSKLTLEGLIDFLGVKDSEFLRKQFKLKFGSELEEEKLNQASFICSYYCWRFNQDLGAMQGRWDSDLLAARSSVLVTFGLIILNAFFCLIDHDLFRGAWLMFLFMIFLGSTLAFNYHRKKRVYGRFAVFLALSDGLQEKATLKPQA